MMDVFSLLNTHSSKRGIGREFWQILKPWSVSTIQDNEGDMGVKTGEDWKAGEGVWSLFPPHVPLSALMNVQFAWILYKKKTCERSTGDTRVLPPTTIAF